MSCLPIYSDIVDTHALKNRKNLQIWIYLSFGSLPGGPSISMTSVHTLLYFTITSARSHLICNLIIQG